MSSCIRKLSHLTLKQNQSIMIEEVISKETLSTKLAAIEQKVSSQNSRYYYLKSISNFIYHLDNFKSNRTKERMAVRINNYLVLLEEIINREHDLHSAAKELLPEIWKISNAYSDEVGFIREPSVVLHLLIGTVLFFLLKFGFGIWVAVVIIGALGVFIAVRSWIKVKARRYW